MKGVFVLFRLIIVEQSSQCIQGTGNLEDFAHLILEKLVEAAVVVEAELRQVIEVLFNCASVIDIEVNSIEQATDGNDLREVIDKNINVVHE